MHCFKKIFTLLPEGMKSHKEDDNAACCEICGAIGWKEVLLTCSKCKGGHEHAYCTKFHTLIIPEYWVCEPCGSKCVSTSPLKEDQGIGSRASKMYQRNKTAKVKLLTGDEVIRLSSGASHPVSSTNVLGKHQRNDEIHKKTMTSKHASCSLSKGPTKECVEENQHSLGRVIADHNIQDYYSLKEKLANKAPFEASSTRNSSPFADLDYLSKMDPAKSSTFARLFAQRGGDVRKPGGSSSCAPTTAVVPATSLPIQKAPPPPPTAEVPTPNSARRPADKAPPAEPIPKKKGKRKVVRELSAESKHAKRSLPDGPPLSGPLSPNSWVAKRIHFDLFAEEKALVSGMTEEEASNMAMELATRSTMCLAYAAQKRASASTEFQVLQEKFDAAVKSNQDLTLRLAETERMAEEDKKKASTLLAEARATQRRMQRSLDDAKLDLQKATASNTKLMAERDGLLADQDSLQDRLTKLEADNKFLGDEVMNEHLLGFEKALAQCNLLFQVPTDDPRLDVSMMVVDEKLVPIHVPPPSPPAVPTVEAVVEVIEETDGADVQP
ncbi:uncharacterized protein LOC108331807 [Vigna angularis]|uniref:uncharacterized protein LOC108331807 n=1 Tax=Phaseolus angularis TaxID=3914 RepID=UPI00080A6E76|nr:uncharacterized protein LOC108331807 [Vigna angularis]